MKNLFCIAAACLVGALSLQCCKNNDATPSLEWKKFQDFGGVKRTGSSQFTIGDKTYVGLGYGGTNGNQYLNDFYVFDLTSGVWDTIRHFPGTGREMAFSFSLNGKGYLGTGFNRFAIHPDSLQMRDFWEYDPTTNQWTQRKNFPGNSRYSATAFATQNYGYAGQGFDGTYFDDFYKYDPSADMWEQLSSPDSKRRGAMSMVINNTGYIFGGEANGIAVNDLYKYDESKGWTNLTPLSTDSNYGVFTDAVSRYFGSTLVVNGTGYVTCGTQDETLSNTTYQYNPTTNIWTAEPPFLGSKRYLPSSWVIGGRAFIGRGQNGSDNLTDIWELVPKN